MAVSVDRVYQTVLALANKEQRGYITPQEFNLFANHAQMDIFEQYFYDLNQFKRVPGNSVRYSDIVTVIEDKLEIFKTSVPITGSLYDLSNSNSDMVFTMPEDVYRIDKIRGRKSVGGSSMRQVEKLTETRLRLAQDASLTRATEHNPTCYLRGTQNLVVFPNTIDYINLLYIKKPTLPNWTYVVVNDKALWNGNGVDFEVHKSEEQNLVVKIAKLAGISMKDTTLAQAASSEEISNIQQEKA